MIRRRKGWKSEILASAQKLPYNPGYDAHVLWRDPSVVASAHGEGLATASLPVGKHCRIVAQEAALEQGRHTGVIDLLL